MTESWTKVENEGTPGCCDSGSWFQLVLDGDVGRCHRCGAQHPSLKMRVKQELGGEILFASIRVSPDGDAIKMENIASEDGRLMPFGYISTPTEKAG